MPEPTPKESRAAEQLEDMHRRFTERQLVELATMADMLGSGRRLLWSNFLAGVARGVGFFLGVSLVGGLLVGLLVIFFENTARTLGLQDFTLKKAVFSAYAKYAEIQNLLVEAEAEVARAEAAAATAVEAADRAERLERDSDAAPSDDVHGAAPPR
ncbi:MAG: DUF5665 domain-containing protein [Planctomycetota bacterium]